MNKVIITGNDLTLEEFVNVCRYGYKVELSLVANKHIYDSNKIMTTILSKNECIYGVNTGFGILSDVSISTEDCMQLQKNLIMSHAVGVGEKFSTDVVRGIILLRINNLAKGYSGVRNIVVDTLVMMLNKGVHPTVPEKGSLGASGDLVPMSHVVLPLLGLGYAEYNGVVLDGKEAMQQAQIPLLQLKEKEGLACINGTQAMTAVGALTLFDSINIMKIADISASLTFEALNGIMNALDNRIHMLRPYKGQIDTARIMSALLLESEMTTNQGDLRNQDAYSLRCIPQVHGASKDLINYVKDKVKIEMNSVTDNPIIIPESNEVISVGNFHGQPMALCFDFLCIALSELASISERRIERLVNPALNEGLPCSLVKNSGINSGYMIIQYAAAALVSENKVLSHPACVDSIPSSCNQEDHVSMGTISARKAREIMLNTRKVLAMELLCACQGIDLRGRKKLGKGTAAAYTLIREKVPMLESDREVYLEINECEQLIIREVLTSKVESIIGELNF